MNKIIDQWDASKFSLSIAGLDASDVDVELTGFDDDEIHQMIGLLAVGGVADDALNLTAAVEAAFFIV